MHETGVIHGRFQVLHNDHMRYLLAGRARCRHLVVGITNPSPELTRADPADAARSTPEANPLTYWERYRLLRDCLTAAGVAEKNFSVVPLPINMPESFQYYVPLDGAFFLSIYDDWGRKKLRTLRGLGLTTEVLWELPPEKKGISATDVRRRMVLGEPWEHLVPQASARLLRAWDVPARLAALAAQGAAGPPARPLTGPPDNR
ncbi:MAG: nicotinate-nucleotide adenylyltransferase [Desulfovibrionaceae bacterium]|jgi:nicotinamide-nucleotide adenylyltransferase|nr:nicotinate-nucleotide adenylyltransferase [Desulfovibrionaceae bacterium]